MTGIYGGDGERMSLRATFPQLRALELEHGSLLRGLTPPEPGGRPPFVSLRDGMDTLVTHARAPASSERASSPERDASGVMPHVLRLRGRARGR